VHLAAFVDILPTSLGPYLAILIAGFMVGWYGHGLKSNWVIAFGIVLILAAVILLQLAVGLRPGGKSVEGF
jgi:hypothetical protein